MVALLSLSSWCIVMVVWLFLAVPWVCLPFVIVVIPDHTHLLFLLIFQKQLYYFSNKNLNGENVATVDSMYDVTSGCYDKSS